MSEQPPHLHDDEALVEIADVVNEWLLAGKPEPSGVYIERLCEVLNLAGFDFPPRESA